MTLLFQQRLLLLQFAILAITVSFQRMIVSLAKLFVD